MKPNHLTFIRFPFFMCLHLRLAKTEVVDIGLDDAEGVGVTHTALPALNNDNGLALVENVEGNGVAETPLDATINILLPVDLAKVGLGLGEKEGVDTTVKMGEPRSRIVPGDHDNGAHRAVLGDKTSGLAGGGENEDGSGVKVEGGADRGHGARFDNGDGALGQAAKLLEVADVGDGVLGLEDGLAHLTDSLVGVSTLGRLTRKHDAISTIGNSVADIADLCSGGSGVLDHGLKHLGSADDGLASNVAHGNDLLLGSKHLGGGNLDTQVATSNHNTVGLGENLSEVVETLPVLDLGNDLNVLALLAEDLTDVLDVLTATDEG